MAAEETKEQKNPTATGKPTNCMQCNKRLKRKNWYYRNGSYFCNKRCWKATLKKMSSNKKAS